MSRIVVGGERASYMLKIACSRPPSHPARGALGEAQCIYWPSFALPAAAAAAHRRSRPSLSLSLSTPNPQAPVAAATLAAAAFTLVAPAAQAATEVMTLAEVSWSENRRAD